MRSSRILVSCKDVSIILHLCWMPLAKDRGNVLLDHELTRWGEKESQHWKVRDFTPRQKVVLGVKAWCSNAPLSELAELCNWICATLLTDVSCCGFVTTLCHPAHRHVLQDFGKQLCSSAELQEHAIQDILSSTKINQIDLCRCWIMSTNTCNLLQHFKADFSVH